MRKGRINESAGFTLVELLIVVAIIGILAAIAIPQFAMYRQNAYCSSLKSDLANLAISQESYYYNNSSYVIIAQTGVNSNIPGHKWSSGTVLGAATGDTNAWTASVSNPNCPNSPISYDSTAGGLQ